MPEPGGTAHVMVVTLAVRTGHCSSCRSRFTVDVHGYDGVAPERDSHTVTGSGGANVSPNTVSVLPPRVGNGVTVDDAARITGGR